MTSTTAPEQLTKVVREGSPADCRVFLERCDAAARRQLGDVAVALFTEYIDAYFKNPSPATLQKPNSARVAVLATGSLEQVISCDWNVIPEPALLIEVFDTFQPDWTNAWVQHVLDENPYMMRHIHWLWETELCTRPESESFVHGLIATHSFLHWPVEASGLRATPALSDPRLATTPAKQAALVDDLWRFFEVKGRGEFSLGYLDLGAAWRSRLIELCEAGHMPRHRLLDASLAALGREFNQAEARCFARLYSELKPTAEEQNARCDKLLTLLNAEMPTMASFALKAVKQVNKDYPIPAAVLIEALKPVFLSPNKGTAIAAIQLVKDTVKRAPDAMPAATYAVLQGLLNRNEDVQEAFFLVLKDWSTDLSQGALLELRDTASVLPARIRDRALTLCNSTGGKTSPTSQ